MTAHRDEPHRMIVYSRPGCELCEEMIAALEFSTHAPLHHFTVVDIDNDAQLIEKYGIDIPVLTIDGHTVCQHRLDEASVLRKLSKHQ